MTNQLESKNKELINKLKVIRNDRNFIHAILTYVCEDESKVDEMLAYIDTGENVNDTNIMYLAINLSS